MSKIKSYEQKKSILAFDQIIVNIKLTLARLNNLELRTGSHPEIPYELGTSR